jgi:uncharacterized protein (TIGR03083 family)
MDDATTWKLIHAERAATADTLATLTPDQWSQASLCAGWTVQMTAGHLVQGAEQSTGSFMKGMLANGFRFNTMMDQEARRLGSLPPAELIARLQARTTTTNKAPAPVVTMLGEVVAHTEDITRPLGLAHEPAPDALVACLDMYKGANFPVGAKKRIAGLGLSATDLDWTYGDADAPEARGPAMSLVMVMAGRPAGLAGLEGPGVAELQRRMS